jgi:hypothetical protein
MHGQLKYLKYAELFDKLGYFQKSDFLLKIAQDRGLLNLRPEFLKFFSESTDFNQLTDYLRSQYPNANHKQIYRNLSRFMHPDLNSNELFSGSLQAKLNKWWEIAEKKPNDGRLEDLSAKANDYFERNNIKFTAGTQQQRTQQQNTQQQRTQQQNTQQQNTQQQNTQQQNTQSRGNVAGEATETAAKGAGAAADDAANAAAKAGAAAKAEGLAAQWLKTPIFKNILGLFQKLAPAFAYLPPVAVAIELAVKAMNGEELDGWDFGKLVSGIALIPTIPLPPPLKILAGVLAFGGLDTGRYLTDNRKGLDIMGVNVAIKDEDYDKQIDKAILTALAKLNAKSKLIRLASAAENFEEKSFVFSCLLREIAAQDLLNKSIRLASNEDYHFAKKIFKSAQTNVNYFDKAGVNQSSYIGSAEDNEKLRRAIDPSAPNLYTAFKNKFNFWENDYQKRIPYLAGQSGTPSSPGTPSALFNEIVNNELSNLQVEGKDLHLIAGAISYSARKMFVASGQFGSEIKVTAADKPLLQRWISGITSAAELYKNQSTSGFSLAYGEARRKEVESILEVLNSIPVIKDAFRMAISQNSGG